MKDRNNPPQYKLRVGNYRVVILLDKNTSVWMVQGTEAPYTKDMVPEDKIHT